MPGKTQPISVVIVEDNRFMQKALTTLLSGDPDLHVVGTASNPYEARDMIRDHQPDVLTLDIEMPRMDGITFLEKLMQAHPMPVVMITSTSEKSAPVALDALEMGAFDVITKPTEGDMQGLITLRDTVRGTLKAAVVAKKQRMEIQKTSVPSGHINTATDRVIGIGASTGGVEALRRLFSELPALMPPIVVAQHMPAEFLPSFARRLDAASALNVQLAQHDAPLLPGHIYLAPGKQHMEVRRVSKNRWHSFLIDGDCVNGHCPSIDILFTSLAKEVSSQALGVLMTGMGHDGARGLLHMHKAGGTTIAQDETSCVVYGMPAAAAKLGAVEHMVPLSGISHALLKHCYGAVEQ